LSVLFLNQKLVAEQPVGQTKLGNLPNWQSQVKPEGNMWKRIGLGRHKKKFFKTNGDAKKKKKTNMKNTCMKT